MRDALIVHRLQFAFTITYHYLFPQLTIGLALVLFLMKTQALRTGDPFCDRTTRFWAKIFGINFAMDVLTGISHDRQHQGRELPAQGEPQGRPDLLRYATNAPLSIL